MTKDKKNILVITNMYPGKISSTFGIFVKNQVEALRKRNMNIDVAAVKDPRMGKKNVLRKYLKWMLRILSVLLLKGKTYNLVHVHYVFPSGMFGLWFKKLFGTKLVVTAHGGDIDKMPKKSPFIYKQTKSVLLQADHVIAVGEALREEMIQEFGVNPSKISLMSMGVNREIFASVPQAEAKEKLGLSQDKQQLLFVGNIIEAKGMLELLSAYKQAKQNIETLELHLVGSPKQEAFLNQMKEIIERENMKDVYFQGGKPQQEVALWMSAADAFVLPSHIEGFGLVAVEAMSCHTPVIGTDVGGLSYLLQNDHGFLVHPKDAGSLAEGIEKVIQDKNLQQLLINNGEKRARENDQEVLVDRLQEIYQKIGAN